MNKVYDAAQSELLLENSFSGSYKYLFLQEAEISSRLDELRSVSGSLLL